VADGRALGAPIASIRESGEPSGRNLTTAVSAFGRGRSLDKADELDRDTGNSSDMEATFSGWSCGRRGRRRALR
jgi:hypothetical protein